MSAESFPVLIVDFNNRSCGPCICDTLFCALRPVEIPMDIIKRHRPARVLMVAFTCILKNSKTIFFVCYKDGKIFSDFFRCFLLYGDCTMGYFLTPGEQELFQLP